MRTAPKILILLLILTLACAPRNPVSDDSGESITFVVLQGTLTADMKPKGTTVWRISLPQNTVGVFSILVFAFEYACGFTPDWDLAQNKSCLYIADTIAVYNGGKYEIIVLVDNP